MTHRRGGHAMVAVGTDLYVLGGWNNDLFMTEVEVFDARANAWREHASLKTPHAYFSAAHLDGKLYVLGGMADQQVPPPPLHPLPPTSPSKALDVLQALFL